MKEYYHNFKAEDLAEWYGKNVEVEIKEKGITRSQRQNAFIHKFFTDLGKYSDTGYTPEEFKIMLKDLFLSEIVYIGSDAFKVVKSTTKLTVKEFNKFIEDCLDYISLNVNATLVAKFIKEYEDLKSKV